MAPFPAAPSPSHTRYSAPVFMEAIVAPTPEKVVVSFSVMYFVKECWFCPFEKAWVAVVCTAPSANILLWSMENLSRLLRLSCDVVVDCLKMSVHAGVAPFGW